MYTYLEQFLNISGNNTFKPQNVLAKKLRG